MVLSLRGNKIISANNKNDLIVITGCDTGIGKSLAEVLSQRGFSLALSYLNEPPFEFKPSIYAKKLDMRIPEEVDTFCLFVKDLCKNGMILKAVVSNAGIAVGGPVENLPLSIYRESFEINFFGAVKIIQVLIPILIKSKGKIIVNGSNAGKIALPFLSPYVSTKYALEGFCDSLRREMNNFGVKTVLLEPASVSTPIWDKAKHQDVSFIDEKYIKSFKTGLEKIVNSGNRGMNTIDAANMIANIISLKKPKARYIISKNKFVTRFLQLLPSAAFDKISVSYFGLNYTNQYEPKSIKSNRRQ